MSVGPPPGPYSAAELYALTFTMTAAHWRTMNAAQRR